MTNIVVFAYYWIKEDTIHKCYTITSFFLVFSWIGTLWHQETHRFQYKGAEGVILARVGLSWQEITRNCKESQINLIQKQDNKFGSSFQSIHFRVCILDQFSSRVNIVSAYTDAKSYKSKDRIFRLRVDVMLSEHQRPIFILSWESEPEMTS